MLRSQQQEMVSLIKSRENLIIVSTMGSGKSGAVLTAIIDQLNRAICRRVLIIAPLRVARDVWPAEVDAWEHTRLMSVALAVGPVKRREAAVDMCAELTVTNFENLPWLYRYCGRDWPFDVTVIDESSALKSGKKRTSSTKRKGADGKVRVTKGGNLTRFGALTKVRARVNRMILLTGTPAPNGVHDLWGQIYLIDQGKRLGATMTAFEDRWFVKSAYSYDITPRPGAEEDIMARISDVMFSFPPPADLPEPVFVPIRVQLSDEILTEYRNFKRKLVSEIHDVEAVSQGVLTNKLLQFSSGSMYREDRSIAHIHDAKLDALTSLVEEAAGDPLLVFYSFKFDLDRIMKRFPYAVKLGDENVVKDWNAGKIKLLLAHPKSCAHGLNLQFGGHLAVWYGLTWSLELYLQANARLPRPGQKWPVAIYQIIAEGTDDQRLLDVLSDRNSTQESITASVRSAIVNTQLS